jgi:hypothetical protein
MVKTLILNSSNVANSDNTRYLYKFPNSLQLNQGDKLSLAALTLPYSNYNINDDLYNNARLSIIYNGQTTNILIPNGSYSIETLNEFIHAIIRLSTNNLPYSTSGSGLSTSYNYFIINQYYNLS